MTLAKTGKGAKPAARTRARAHPPPGAAPARFLHLSPEASPPTCSLAAGLEGRAPGYPALGKEILRPYPENLGSSGRKKLTTGPGPARGAAGTRRNPRPAVPPRSECVQPGPIPPAVQPDPNRASRSPALKARHVPLQPLTQTAASLQGNGGKPTSPPRCQSQEVRNPVSAVDPIGAGVFRRIRELTS